MKLSIAIAALTTLVNGQATNGTTTTNLVLQVVGSRIRKCGMTHSSKHPGFIVIFRSLRFVDITPSYPSVWQMEPLAACDLITARPFDTSLELFDEGYLEDVTDMAVLDKFSDVTKTTWQTDDGPKTFAIPLASVITGFIYNKNAFDALAIEAPKTQDEFYAALGKLKEDGTYVPLAMGGTGDLANAYGSEKGFMNIGPNFWKGEEGRRALLDDSEKLMDTNWVDPWLQLLQWVLYTGDNGMSQTQKEAMEIFMNGAAAVYRKV